LRQALRPDHCQAQATNPAARGPVPCTVAQCKAEDNHAIEAGKMRTTLSHWSKVCKLILQDTGQAPRQCTATRPVLASSHTQQQHGEGRLHPRRPTHNRKPGRSSQATMLCSSEDMVATGCAAAAAAAAGTDQARGRLLQVQVQLLVPAAPLQATSTTQLVVCVSTESC
jgi:hypothetical protein